MEWEPVSMDDPSVPEAVAELQAIIRAHYPDAAFDVFEGEDPTGMYLRATVDVEDPDEVVELFIDRMVDMQVEERLPVYVLVVRPRERIAASLRAHQAEAEAALPR